jgi:hypothetical protein
LSKRKVVLLLVEMGSEEGSTKMEVGEVAGVTDDVEARAYRVSAKQFGVNTDAPECTASRVR